MRWKRKSKHVIIDHSQWSISDAIAKANTWCTIAMTMEQTIVENGQKLTTDHGVLALAHTTPGIKQPMNASHWLMGDRESLQMVQLWDTMEGSQAELARNQSFGCGRFKLSTYTSASSWFDTDPYNQHVIMSSNWFRFIEGQFRVIGAILDLFSCRHQPRSSQWLCFVFTNQWWNHEWIAMHPLLLVIPVNDSVHDLLWSLDRASCQAVS